MPADEPEPGWMDRVWVQAEPSDMPGQMRIFLSDGTLVMDSCWEVYRLAAHPLRWQLLAALAEGDQRVRELVARLGAPQSLVSYHLRRLRDAGLVSVRRSSFDGRDSYYHLDLDRCADALAGTGAALHPGLRRESFPAIAGPQCRDCPFVPVCPIKSAGAVVSQ